jgi:hypothetical protein
MIQKNLIAKENTVDLMATDENNTDGTKTNKENFCTFVNNPFSDETVEKATMPQDNSQFLSGSFATNEQIAADEE